VTVTNENATLHIIVQDDGKGFRPETTVEREDGGRGLPSMSERARRVGGTFGIASTPGTGTRVTLALPI
jgi:signal transduction histidine kinase